MVSKHMKQYSTTLTIIEMKIKTVIQYYFITIFLVAQMVKNLPAMQETRVQFLGGKIPWRREWQPISAFLPGEFHGQRSLVGCSLWGHKELT